MKKIIGYLKNITAEAFARDAEGNLRPIHAGEAVYQGETVVDGSGQPIPDALRAAKENEPAENSTNGDVHAEVASHEQSHSQENPRSTTSTDSIETNDEEVNINAPLRENRFNTDNIWLQNSGLIRHHETGDEVDINAPLREAYFPPREFEDLPFFSAQSQEITLKIVPTDAFGNIIDPVKIPEGSFAYYKVIAVDENGNELTNVQGTVRVHFYDGTASSTGSYEEGTLDYEAYDATVHIGEVFSAKALDDYIIDGNETFFVEIVKGTFSDEDAYGAVHYPQTPVETVIVDNGSDTPSSEPDSEGVLVKLVPTDAAGNIISPATIPEGGKAYYKAILIGPDGQQIVNATGNVNIVFSDGTAVRTGSATDATLDFSASNASVALNQVFSAEALDDFMSDSGETFNVQIVPGTYTEAGNYETVSYDTTPIVTTIIDDTGTPNTLADGPEGDHEVVLVKLVALDENGDPILDANGHYTFANDVREGVDANYMALAFAPGTTTFSPSTKLANQVGNVQVEFADGTAVGAAAQTEENGTQDYNSNAMNVSLGTVIAKETFDDYMADNGETFTVSIVDNSYSPSSGGYENVQIDTAPVTTTIKDDSGTAGDDPLVRTDETNDPDNAEPDHEIVQIKLVALDENGDPIFASDGKTYVYANGVDENNAAQYKALAFAPGATEYTTDTVLEDINQVGSVTVSTRDLSTPEAVGVASQTTQDGSEDYTTVTAQQVDLNTAFSVDTLDDYLADSGERFEVVIDANSYQPAPSGGYENVDIDTSPVTTTINDDSGTTPNDPNTLTDDAGAEPDHEVVQIKLVALNSDGSPVLVGGEYTVANSVNEGDDAKYMAVAFAPGETVFSPATQLANQLGTVDVTFANNTAIGASSQNAEDGTEDYNNTAQATVTLGTEITTATFDDYMSDNNETFTISITDNSYAPDSNGGYENVSIDTSPVTTTILDDTGTPNTPTDGVEADHEQVIIKLVALDENGDPILDGSGNYTFANSVNENNAAQYKAVAFAPGETTFSPTTQLANQSGAVTVSSRNTSPAQAVGINHVQDDWDGTEDYTSISSQTVNLDTAFSIDTLDDYMSDDGEQFEVVIDADSYTPATGGYENVSIDTSPVTTTIYDNTNPNTPNDATDGSEADSEPVIIKLIALDESGNPILDGSGNYTFANSVKEGNAANYMALAFAPGETTFNDSTKLAIQTGTVDVEFTDATATGAAVQTAIDGTQDYNNTTQTSLSLGTVISTDSFDDYRSDDGETYNVSIVADSYVRPSATSGYEDVSIDTSPVTTTIGDGLLSDASANEPIDTVYVQLYTDAIQDEADGALLTHTIKLVDKDGNDVTLAVGETVTVNLAYSNDTTVDADFQGGKITTLTLNGDGGSTYTFSNVIANDNIDEGQESYEVAVSSASSTVFENMLPDPGLNGNPAVNYAKGTINENVTLNDDAETLVEGGNTIDNTTTGMNLLDNDETGINGKITSINYKDETGTVQTAALVSGTVTVDTQYGTVTVNEDGTWSYTSDQTENNPTGVDDVITYTLQDDLGKTGTADFTLTVTDTDPSATAPNEIVDEENLTDGSNPDNALLTVTQNFNITKGADDIADVRFTDTSALQALNLTSQGTALSYSLSNGDHTITATAGSNTIFTIDILNPNDAAGTQQQYQFTLQGDLDHPSGNGENAIDLPFDFTVADTDSQVAGSQFTVTVIDDVPTANSEPTLSVVEGNVALTGMIDLMANDVTGADDPLSLQGFRYKDESGTWQTGTFGVAEDTQYGTLTVNSDGSWSYTSDAMEDNESGTDNAGTNDFVTDQFEYTVVDRDGDTSTATQDINVTDGANPQIVADDGQVDEANLGLGNTFVPTSVTKTLGITKGSDNIADTKFDITTTQNALQALNLTAGGVALTYAVTAAAITATAGGETIFTVDLNNTTDATGTSQSYTFTLHNPLDHVDNGLNGDNSINDPMYLPFTVYTYDTDDANGVDGDDDATDTFTVQIIDSLPSASNQTIATDEDTSVTFRLSIDDFNGDISITPTNGTTAAVASGNSTDIYDAGGDDVIGTLTNNGDGTVTFNPNANYSNYSGTLPTFDYTVTDEDGDQASGTITLQVNPVADAPNINENDVNTTEDANNTQEGTNEISLELNLPAKSADNTDQNDINGADAGDHPERLGYITLDFTNASDVAGAVVQAGGNSYTIDSSNTQIKVYITDVANYHYAGLNPAADGAWSLTQAQYEAMTITPAEDNDRYIGVSVSVTSYEVDDSDVPLDPNSATLTETYTDTFNVNIEARTDDISLAWNDTARGTISTTANTDDTYTFNTISEGDTDRTIDLTALLTQVSGTENDTSPNGGDLDGSEYRSYTITGIPNGTIVTLGGVSVAASGGTDDNTPDASVTVDFPDNTAADPSFILTLPEQFGGSISNGVIRLETADHDVDTAYVDMTKSAEVYFNIDVIPTADIVTLQVVQPIGDEDAGRTNGNDANDAIASTIDAPANGINLDIIASSDDDDGSETYTITVDQVPTGGSLYYNGTLFDPTNPPPSASGLTVTDNGDGTWKVEITDFDNNAPFTFVPPHNSDADYTFHIEGISVEHNADGSVATDSSGNIIQQLSPTTLDIDVQVNDIADIPVNDDLAAINVTDDDGDNNPFNTTGVEDAGPIDLKNILATPDLLDSYDDDGSETLTMKITGLASGFDIQGGTLVSGSGTGRVWFVDVADLQAGNVKLVSPQNYAGEVNFKLGMVTTENEGDSKTHPDKDISIMVTPSAEATMNLTNTQIEDETVLLDFSIIKPDTDPITAGEESFYELAIDANTLPSGIILTDQNGNVLVNVGGFYYATVTNGIVDPVYATLPEDSHMDGSYSFDVRYIIKDVAEDGNGNTYTNYLTQTDTYTVTVTAVTDDINMTTTTTTTGDVTADAGDAADVTVNGNGSFTKVISIAGIDSDGNGSPDEDGSEKFTRIKVEGVPEGINVGGTDGQYAGDTGAGSYSGVWYVDIPDIILDGNQGTYELDFSIDYSVEVGDYNVTITAYNEDADNGVEQNDTETFVLHVPNSVDSGNVPPPPPSIDAFYQDIDNDGTHDHAYTVSTTVDTTITDGDAYPNSVLREDIPFALADVIHAETTGSGNFSITIQNVTPGVTLSGSGLIESNGIYTFIGSGNEQAIINALNSIIVTPVANDNSDAGDQTGTDLNFDIALTTYADASNTNTALINFSAPVLPVTDPMDLTTVNDGLTNEDVAQTFSITLDNQRDSTNTQIVDGKVYLKVTENYTDVQGNNGTAGTLFDGNGNALSLTNVSGVSGIADGQYYVINGANYNDTLDFSFLPASNRDGSVDVDVYVKNIEGESWSPYDTQELTSHTTVSFTVNAVTDGFTAPTVSANGNEDERTELIINALNPDDSEILSSIVLDRIPNGFLVYYGADAASAQVAQNIGVNGQMQMEMTYGQSELVDYNLWNIPTSGGALPAYIAIQSPAEWSGQIPSVEFRTITDSTTQSVIFDVNVAPVVDNMTINPTKTFGNEGEEIALKLNANVKDLDGSETVTLTLAGLGAGASFKVDGTAISANYDAGTDTYTLTGVAALNVNKLTVVQSATSGTVTVTAKTVESDGTESTLQTSTFDIDIRTVTASDGDEILLYDGSGTLDGLGGTDTVVLKDGVDVDFAGTATPFSNIEILDLTSGAHQLQNIAEEDVTRMTDTNNILTINTDADDTVNLTTQWTDNGNGQYTSNGVTLQINGGATVTASSSVIDGFVEGLEYETSSGLSGITGENGRFSFGFGDTVTFKLGGVVLGSVDMRNYYDDKIFLQDMANVDRTNLSDEYVQKLAVLLQSLDSDSSDKILITDEMREAFADANFNLESMSDEEIAALIEQTGREVVSEEDAMAHVEDMLIAYTDLDEEDFAQDDADTVAMLESKVLSDELGNVTGVRDQNGTMMLVGAAVAGAYGTLVMAEDGSFTYTVNEDALPEPAQTDEGQVVEDSFVYVREDGTEETVTVEVKVDTNTVSVQATTPVEEDTTPQSTTDDDGAEAENADVIDEEIEADTETTEDADSLDDTDAAAVAGILTFDETTIDFASVSIHGAYDAIDLTQGGDHHLLHLELEDVLDLTGGDKSLLIKTDAGDSVDLDGEWTEVGDNVFTAEDGTTVTISGAGAVSYDAAEDTPTEESEKSDDTTEEESTSEESTDAETTESATDTTDTESTEGTDTESTTDTVTEEESLDDILPGEDTSTDDTGDTASDTSTTDTTDTTDTAAAVDPTVQVTVDDQVPEVA